MCFSTFQKHSLNTSQSTYQNDDRPDKCTQIFYLFFFLVSDWFFFLIPVIKQQSKIGNAFLNLTLLHVKKNPNPKKHFLFQDDMVDTKVLLYRNRRVQFMNDPYFCQNPVYTHISLICLSNKLTVMAEFNSLKKNFFIQYSF